MLLQAWPLLVKSIKMSKPSSPSIDREHLARYTMGDEALEVEILGLFLKGADEYLSMLRQHPPGSAEFKRAAHSLKGSARGVGAFEVGDLAFACEQYETSGAELNALFLRLEEAIARVRQAV